jgi:hypothetical protein
LPQSNDDKMSTIALKAFQCESRFNTQTESQSNIWEESFDETSQYDSLNPSPQDVKPSLSMENRKRSSSDDLVSNLEAKKQRSSTASSDDSNSNIESVPSNFERATISDGTEVNNIDNVLYAVEEFLSVDPKADFVHNMAFDNTKPVDKSFEGMKVLHSLIYGVSKIVAAETGLRKYKCPAAKDILERVFSLFWKSFYRMEDYSKAGTKVVGSNYVVKSLRGYLRNYMYQMLISSIRSNSKTFGRAKNEQKTKRTAKALKS